MRFRRRDPVNLRVTSTLNFTLKGLECYIVYWARWILFYLLFLFIFQEKTKLKWKLKTTKKSRATWHLLIVTFILIVLMIIGLGIAFGLKKQQGIDVFYPEREGTNSTFTISDVWRHVWSWDYVWTKVRHEVKFKRMSWTAENDACN